MATKTNNEDGKVVKGTAKADVITNSGSNVTIDAGAGNDSIENDGGLVSHVSINAGAGNDTVINGYAGGENDAKNITILGGAGDDRIENYISYDVTIDAGTGNDSIIGYSGSLIKYSGGNDYIEGIDSSSTLKIASGTMNSVVKSNGNDLFLTVGKNVITLSGAAGIEKLNIVNSKGKAVKYSVKATLTATNGNDSLTNYADNVSVDAAGGKDTIDNYGNKVTIKGGADNDSISNNSGYGGGESVSIDGGDGNDSISNWSSNVTIDGGKGNDLIENGGDKVLLVYSGGNDTIYNLSNTATIKIASGTMDSVVNTDGANYFLTVGKNTITVANYYGSLGDFKVIDSNGKNVKFTVKTNFNFTEGNDSVTNLLGNVTLDALGGNDYIDNGGSNVSINGGAGNDTIINGSSSNGVGSSVTIDGGLGDDYISNSFGDNVLIKYSGGNDCIDVSYAYMSETKCTIQISSGTMNSVVTSNGTDLFLTVGKNIITLTSAAYYADKVKIIDSKGKDVKFTVKPNFKFTDGNDSVTNELSNISLDALGGNDYVYNGRSSVTIAGGAGNDSIDNYGSTNVSIFGGAGDDSIDNSSYDGSDITIDGGKGNDTVLNDSAKTKIFGGDGDDYIENVGSKVTIDGGGGNDSISLGSFNSDKTLIQYKSGDGNDIIYGFNETSTLKIASGKMNSVVTTNGYDYFLTIGKNIVTLSGIGENSYEKIKPSRLNIVDSKGKDIKFTVKTKIVGTNSNDSLWNTADDATIDGGKGRNEIYNDDADNVLFNYSGGNDSIYGFNATSTLKIASGTVSSVIKSDGNNYFLTVGGNSITLAGAATLNKVNVVDSKGKAVKFTVKEINTINNDKNNAKLNGTADRDLFMNSGAKVSINGGDGSDTISNQGNSATLVGGKGDDSIYNWSEKTSINGGDGSDTIDNGGNSATLVGGKGDDSISNTYENSTIIYSKGDGNDVITGNANETKIKLVGISKVTADFVEDDNYYYPDAVFKIGNGSITVKDATLYGKEITFVDKNNKTISSYTCSSDGIALGKSITLSPSAWGTFYGENFTNIDASKVKDYIAITGGDTASTLKGSAGNDALTGGKGNDQIYGNAGNDYLNGGKGNDSLWGGDGEDTFVCTTGEGTDKICDYASGDLLQILDANGTELEKPFSSSKFSKGALTLTIDKNSKVILDNVSTSTNFNINGTAYHISGTKLVK